MPCRGGLSPLEFDAVLAARELKVPHVFLFTSSIVNALDMVVNQANIYLMMKS